MEGEVCGLLSAIASHMKLVCVVRLGRKQHAGAETGLLNSSLPLQVILKATSWSVLLNMDPPGKISLFYA